MRTVFGAELSLSNTVRTEDPIRPARTCWCWPAAGGYRRLSRQLAAAHLAGGEKGRPLYDYDTLTEAAGGHWHILTGCRKGHVRQALSTGGPEAAAEALADLVDRFGRDRVSVELTHHGDPLDDERNAALAALAPRFGLTVVATTAAHFAEPGRARLAMAMGAIRARQSLDEAAGRLAPLGGSHLRSGDEMARLFFRYPEAVTAAADLGEQCAFGLALIAPSCRRSTFQKATPKTAGCGSWSWSGPPGGTGRGPRPGGLRADRTGARRHRRVEVPGLLPGGARHHPVLSAQRHPVSGKGIGGQLRGLLRAGVTAVDPIANELLFERFLRPPGTGRPTSTSTSNRICARGDPVRLRQVRPGLRRPGRQRHHLSGPQRGARHGPCARVLPGSAGRLEQTDQPLERAGRFPDIEDIPGPVIDLAMQIKNLPRHMGIHPAAW